MAKGMTVEKGTEMEKGYYKRCERDDKHNRSTEKDS